VFYFDLQEKNFSEQLNTFCFEFLPHEV